MIITSVSKNEIKAFSEELSTEDKGLHQAFSNMRNDLRNDLKAINKVKWL